MRSEGGGWLGRSPPGGILPAVAVPREAASGLDRPWVQRLLLVGLVLAVFGRVLGHGFLAWDDLLNVVNNEQLRPPSWAGLAAFWRAPFKGLYVPLAYTYWDALVWITEGGAGRAAGSALDPRLFAAGQVLLHAGSVLLVHGLLRRLVQDGRAALVGAAVFAVHPLQVEAVAWLSEARGLLSGLLVLGALSLFLRWRARGGWPEGVLAAACLSLGLLAKPSAVVGAPLAVVLARLAGHRWRACLLGALPWFALAGVFVLVSASVQVDEQQVAATPLAGRLVVALDALGHYASKLLWPTGLAPDHGRRPEWVLAAGWRQVNAALFVATALLLRPWRRIRVAGPLALFVLGLTPVLGLVPFDHQLISTVADRYAYLALLGPALGVALALERRPRWGPVATVLLAVLAGLSFVQVGRWKDTRALFEHNLALYPASPVAHMQLGILAEADFDLMAARRHYEAALAQDPLDAKAWTNLGNVRYACADTDGALEAYERSLALRPKGKVARMNVRRLEKAIAAWRATLESERAAAEAGDLRARLRRAEALEGLGRPSEAAAEYERALEANPEGSAAALGLAWILASSADPAVADPERALELAGGSATARAHWIRAQAHAALGAVPLALQDCAAASAAAARTGNEDLARRVAGWRAGLERGERPPSLRP